LIAQIAWSPDHISIAESVKQKYDQGSGKMSGLDENLLADLMSPYERTVIVIDALDECDDYTKLLLRLQTVSEKRPAGSVKFFFSSRANVELTEFPSRVKIELDSQKELTAEDLETYIRTQVKERKAMRVGRPLLGGKRPDLEDRLIYTLILRAQGM
jgi:hypothetical protein